jgi:hypothetical protein
VAIDEVDVKLCSVVVDRLTEECGLVVVVFDIVHARKCMGEFFMWPRGWIRGGEK